MLTLSTSLLSAADIGVRIQAPIGNGGVVDIGFRSDDHRYDSRYKYFDYDRYGYYDDYGYYFGYFDRNGYFFNNIYFLYDSRYTYYDRLHRRGYFIPRHVHYRPYQYHEHNDWNRSRNYIAPGRYIEGPYYERREMNYNNRFNDDRRNDYRKYDEHRYDDKKYRENVQVKDRNQYQEKVNYKDRDQNQNRGPNRDVRPDDRDNNQFGNKRIKPDDQYYDKDQQKNR